MKEKRKQYTVKGISPFPIDMLRYDLSWPASEIESSKISTDWRQDIKEVTLTTDSPFAPTVGRWESFGWKVVK